MQCLAKEARMWHISGFESQSLAKTGPISAKAQGVLFGVGSEDLKSLSFPKFMVYSETLSNF